MFIYLLFKKVIIYSIVPFTPKSYTTVLIFQSTEYLGHLQSFHNLFVIYKKLTINYITEE